MPEASTGPVRLRPRWEPKPRLRVGSAFSLTEGRPAGSREHQRQPDRGGGCRRGPPISPTGWSVCFIRLVGAAPQERGPGPGVWPPWPPVNRDVSDATRLTQTSKLGLEPR